VTVQAHGLSRISFLPDVFLPSARCVVLVLAAFSLLSDFAATVFAEEEKRDQTPPKFSVETYSTLFEFRVLDYRGQPVRGLTREDISVSEEGKPRSVLLFEEREVSSISLAILVDLGSSANETQLRDCKQAIHELVHLLDPADEILIGVYHREVEFLSELTRDRLELVEAINNIAPGARPSKWQKLVTLFASSGHTGFAVDMSLLKLQEASGELKIVLILSAGAASIGEATEEHLRQARTRVFLVSWKNRLGEAFNLWGDRTARKHLMQNLGGVPFNGYMILEQVQALADAMQSYYLMAYNPADLDKALDERDVEIRVPTRPGYSVYKVRSVEPSEARY